MCVSKRLLKSGKDDATHVTDEVQQRHRKLPVTHRVFGFEFVALGLFRGVVRHHGLGRLSTHHVTEDDRVCKTTRPHIRRKFRVLQLILMTFLCAPKPTFVELLRRKVTYGLVLQHSNRQ